MASYGKKSGAKFWGWVILVLGIYIAGGLTLPPMIKNAKGWAIEKLSDTPKETPKKEEPKKEAPTAPKEEEKETVKDEIPKEEASKEEAPTQVE
ncbi:MAG: hypothetical protein LBO09_01670 [Candidatus Peribacteria bacterium]|jgi:hypothetical protein|nr:hypothetical protein [Candidatus Peribacteria bacterium]